MEETVVCYLQQLAAEVKDPFKKRAYKNAIESLRTHLNGPLVSADQVKNLPGIGKSIFEKIRGVLEENTFQELSAEAVETCTDPDKSRIIEALTKVPSIGLVTAEKLYHAHNIRSLDDLRKHPELLTDAQKVGLKHVEDIQLRIPRKEMVKHDAFLGEVIKEVDPEATYVIAGSYRRGLESSGDIDLLIQTNKSTTLTDLVALLKKKKYILDDLAHGSSKYMGMAKVKYGRHARRLDILVMDAHRFPFAVLYFTGSQNFNVQMRKEALKKGYSLSEYGLKNEKGEFVTDASFRSEEDIFRFLGMSFVAPMDRRT